MQAACSAEEGCTHRITRHPQATGYRITGYPQAAAEQKKGIRTVSRGTRKVEVLRHDGPTSGNNTTSALSLSLSLRGSRLSVSV